MNREIDNALEEFKKEMILKFELRDAKQGERSVTKVGNSLLNEPGVPEGLLKHLHSEVYELAEAFGTPEQGKEAVDVANMAFLLWWQRRAKDGENSFRSTKK